MIELCPVDTGFAQQLSALWKTTFTQAYRALHTSENIRAYCESNYTVDHATAALSDPDVVCTVAFRDKSAVGFSLIKHHGYALGHGANSSELKQIYVVASEYGSGAGGLLFDDAIRRIREAGRSQVWLVVSDLNQRARSFYLKMAFESLHPGPVIEIGADRLTSTIMVREVYSDCVKSVT